MEIKTIELLVGETPAGEPTYTFQLFYNDEAGTQRSIPDDPRNADYWVVKEWFEAQETKPFEYDFEEMPEPVFAETIYPPEPEESDQTDEVADEQLALPVEEEPETLLPR